jgi:hypothetical protein
MKKHRNTHPNDVRVSKKRDEASPGIVCSPWQSRAHYLPLVNVIAERTDLTTGDKLLYSTIVRWFFMTYSNDLSIKRLAGLTGFNEQIVRRRMRRFQELDLLRKGLSWTVPKEIMYDLASSIPRVLVDLMIDPNTVNLLTPTLLVVYGRLAGLAGEKGWWFGTHKMLAVACGVSRKTVQDAVYKLEAENLIKVERHSKHKGQGGGWNKYFFLGHKLFTREIEKRKRRTFK